MYVICYGVRTYLARDIDVLNLPAISSVPPFGVATSAQVATRHVNMSGLRTYEFRTALIGGKTYAILISNGIPAAFTCIEACRLLSCFGGWWPPAPAVEFAAHPRQFRHSPANLRGDPPM